MSIYVVPDDGWNNDINGFEMQQINFTWKAKYFKGKTLNIDLNFNNVSYISPNQIQDNLVVWMNENKTFFKQNQEPYKFINKNSTILKTRIVKQISYNQIQATIEAATKNAANLMMITLIVQVLLRTLFSGSLTHMISLINAL